ncbi:lipopolysaccharide biosynthesis protein [Methylobacterium planeticum]|uniref:Lipopolysaccharide biosynthesis protein n=1 Tax=Methylobacterium planeticum TaxID=2615211 RepID=A0A6N6MJ31_9HYPH|nr:lipopolysaccharide biosynthesis protein [Methylobacterium planeticum]KAB1069573.1 lipopolysaccharide biosynthesis protein [Methylobacterium planeticum]
MAQRVARNSLLSAIASGATMLASAGTMIIAARTLGVEGTGIVTLSLWLVTMAVTIAGLGLPTTVTRYVAEAGDAARQRALARRFFRPTLGAALCLLALAGSAAAALATGRVDVIWSALAPETLGARIEIWLILGLTGAAQILGQYHLGVLRGQQDFRAIAALTLAGFGVQMVATLVGALAFGIAGALAGCALGALPAALAAARAALDPRGRAEPPSDALVTRMRRFALYTWAGSVMSAFVWARIEIYFLQRSEGYEAVGLFTAGLTLASLATQGPLLLTGALLPHFANAHARGAGDRVREAYASATRLIAFLVFPAGLGLAAIMPVVMPLVFGESFRPAVPVASLLVAVAAIGATSAVGTHLVNALERSDFVFYSSLCGAVLALTAGFTLVPAFGLIGAGAARALIQLAMVGAGLWFITRRLGCPAPFRDLGKLFVAASLAALAARSCLHLIPGPLALLAALPAAALVYGICVRRLHALTAADRDRLRGALSLLPGPLGLCGRPVLLLIRN